MTMSGSRGQVPLQTQAFDEIGGEAPGGV